VITGPPEFFRLTKRLHNALHGSAGDGSPLGPEAAALYAKVMHDNIVSLDELVRPGDVVICHDPQTAGLVPHYVRKGCFVVWRCHIGHEKHDVEVDRGWAFLRPYLESAHVAVFSRSAYAPPWIEPTRTVVLAPNIDPFSAKNQEMDDATVRAILGDVGLVEGPDGAGAPTFLRDDGSSGRVDRKAEVLRLGRAPSWDAKLVVQVSRWDHIKDPIGVLEGFARLVEPGVPGGAQLVLAGPTTQGGSDDPEGAEVFAALEQSWRALPDSLRALVHLAMLPMNDNEENAAIVNALQRHAAVIVQKSLYEGFGLTVTEAMWKRTPVVATRVGGICDQIRDDIDGLLIDNPSDLDEFAETVSRVLGDDDLGERLGDGGHERVKEHYLVITALERWATLIRDLLARDAAQPRRAAAGLRR
jgi:trehalose synthase